MRTDAYNTPPEVRKPLSLNDFSSFAEDGFPSFTNPPDAYRNTFAFSAEDNLFVFACAAFSVSMRYQAEGARSNNEALRFARFLRPHSTSKGAAFVALRRAFKEGDAADWRGDSLARLDQALSGSLIQKSYFCLRITRRFDLLKRTSGEG